MRRGPAGLRPRLRAADSGREGGELPVRRARSGDPGEGLVEGVERLEAEDVADAIAYIVTRPRRVAVNELLVRPTEQAL